MRKFAFNAARAMAAAIALTASLSACGGSSSPAASSTTAAPANVRVISYPGSDSSWLAYIAQQQGYFTSNDLNVSFVSLPAGAQATAALVGGSVDLAVLDTNNVAPLLAQGQKYTLLVNAVTNFWAIVGNKSLAGKSLAQAAAALKGQAVDVPSVGGTGGRQLQAIFAAYGLTAGAVKLVADPTNASLTAGSVKAAMTDTIGACRLTTLGYPEIMNFVNPPQATSSYPAGVQPLIGLAGLGYWSKTSWSDKNPAAVGHFQHAIEQATAWAKSPANATAVASLLRKSAFNLPTMSDSQWATCVGKVTAAFSNTYTAADAATWATIVRSSGLAGSLPPTSEWLAAGIPQS